MSNAVRIALAGSVIFAALAPISQAHATPVTWTFFETSCTAPSGAFACPAPAGLAGLGSPQITFPYALATLTLPGPTSSGSAVWGGYGATPAYTGDTFDFVGGGHISPAFDGAIVNGPAGPREFHITWDETPGNLVAGISLLTVDNEIAPPSAAVRQRSIAFITFNWSRL